MIRKVLSASVLAVAASSAWGFQVSAFYDTQGPQLSESDGQQTVTVRIERGVNDPQGLCIVDITAAGQDFASPPPIDIATPGSDYTPTTSTVTVGIDDNDTFVDATFSVPVLDDAIAEPTEAFAALVTAVTPDDCPSNAVFDIAPEEAIPIFDDDPGNLSLAVDQAALTVDEAVGSVDLGVTLSGLASIEGDFSAFVDWQLVPGSAATPADFGGLTTSGTLFFDASATTQSVTVPIVDDALIESLEDFQFVLSNAGGVRPSDDAVAVGLTQDTTTVQITDNDDPGTWTFVNAPYQVDETAQSATVTVRREGGSAGPLTVFYRAVDGTATAGEDFDNVSGSVSWADGEQGDRTFTVPIIDDGAVEGDETVLIRAGTDSDFVEFEETTLTIVDDESAATTSFSTTAVSAEETGETVVLTLERGGSTAGAVSVDYATQDGTATAGEDYVAASGTVSWADGDGADKTVTITLLEDTEQEQAEDFLVVLSNPTGNATLGGNTAITVTIQASDVTRDISGIPNLTPNQLALANWFDQTCGRLAALDSPTAGQQNLIEVCALVRNPATDDASVREALDEINPEELLVSAFNALRLTAVQHGNLAQRLNALRNGAKGVDLAGLDLEVNGQTIGGHALQAMYDDLTGGGASADENVWGRWGVFVNGRYATGDKDRTDNEAGFDFDLYSITTGVDYRIRDNFIVGVSAGFGSVDSDYDRGDGGLDIDSWNAGAYLTYFRDESFYFDALATYGENDYDSVRNLSFESDLGSFSGSTRGSTDGSQYSLGFGTGWDFNRGGLTFGPHGGAYYFDVDVDGFQESGISGLDLDIGDQSTKSFTVNAGGHVSYAVLTDWGVLVPNLKVDWVHEFEDNSETLAFNFINDPFAGDPSDPSPGITLRSDRPDSNYFIWSVGTSAQFVFGVSGFVNYQSYAGYSNVDIDEWSAGLRWEKTW
jgi:uncharacterized protein YhjY with autotransporter beta-barrel domain